MNWALVAAMRAVLLITWLRVSDRFDEHTPAVRISKLPDAHAGQTCEIISIIENIRSIICCEWLDMLIFLDEMSYPADPEALQALLVICQSFLRA